MTLPRQLLQIDYDQFHRYAAVTVLLKPLLLAWSKDSLKPLRILEVGSHSLNLLPAFLSPVPVEIVRADLEQQFAGDVGPYVTIAKDQALPFNDEAFDVTVAMEVLEHIPAQTRHTSVSEWARVASKGIIFTCPNGESVRDLEARADADFQARHGRVHPWLEEHERYGRPTQEEVETLCNKLSLIHHRFNNSPLAEWLPLLLATEQIFEQSDQQLLARFNEMLNTRPLQAFLQEPGYRSIYAAFKSAKIDQQVQQIWQGTGQFVEQQVIDPVRLLARRLSQFIIEHRRREVDGETLQTLIDENARWKQRLEQTELLLTWERWQAAQQTWRGSWLAAWRKVIGAPENPLPSSKLIDLKSFGPNHWLVCGKQPGFEWTCHHERGWHRLVLEGQVETRQSASIAIDYGNGLNDVHVIRLGAWRVGFDRLVVNAYFHHPVVQMRLTPCQWGSQVVIDRMSITPISSARVALQGLWRLVSELIRAPKLMSRTLRRTSSWLRLGMWLTTKPRRLSHAEKTPEQRWLIEQQSLRLEQQALVERHRTNHKKVAIFLRLEEDTTMRSLEGTLQSLIQQDECRWELWCVAPPQRRADLAATEVFTQLGDRLHWMKDGPDRGVAGLLNECVQASQAEWLVQVQPGDHVMPELGIQLLEAGRCHPQAALLYADEASRSLDDRELELLIKPILNPDVLRNDPMLLESAFAVHGPTLLRLGGFHPCYEGALAIEYIHRLFKAQLPMVQIGRVLLHHPIRPTPSQAVLKVLERIREEYDSDEYHVSYTRVSEPIEPWQRTTAIKPIHEDVSRKDGASC